MRYFFAFHPETDSIDNSGFYQRVDDFADVSDEEMRAHTTRLPTDPELKLSPDRANLGWVVVSADSPPGVEGLTYGEIRNATLAFLVKHDITPVPEDDATFLPFELFLTGREVGMTVLRPPAGMEES